eukprot:15471027-Alexandrium_andersonii.AAC.1
MVVRNAKDVLACGTSSTWGTWRLGRSKGAGKASGHPSPSHPTSSSSAPHSAASSSASSVQSVLVSRCLELYAVGQISATTVQYLCEGACQDGLLIGEVKTMAAMGSHG